MSGHDRARWQPAAPLRDTLLPLEALVEAARTGLGVSVVHLALPPELHHDLHHELHHELAHEFPGDAVESAPQEPRRATLFGLHPEFTRAVVEAVAAADGPVAVEDTRTHERFRATPVIDGRRLLAVLAAPLRDRDGVPVAALYAADSRPRWWSERDQALLAQLAIAATPLLARAVDVARSSAPDATAVHAEHRPEALLDELAEGVLLIGTDWKVRWTNSRAGDHFAVPTQTFRERDVSEVIGAVVDPTVLSAWERAMASEAPVSFSWRQPGADRWFDGYALRAAAGLLVVVRDVTLQRRAEQAREVRAAQVREGETLEAIALLAGGVAHDFNNLLTIISANAELLDQLLGTADGQTELQAIRQAAARASAFTEQLLASGRQLTLQPDVVLVNELLGELEPELRALLPAEVRVDSSLTRHDTRVQVDPARLSQVVRQLARNAGDAMPAGGVLRISTEVLVLETPLRARPKTVPTGAWVVLQLDDNGHGVAPAQLDRIFEPFFTTRAVGAGLGLGLATSYGIVAQSGGYCTVESQHGVGTTLRVWLPALTPIRTQTAANTRP